MTERGRRRGWLVLGCLFIVAQAIGFVVIIGSTHQATSAQLDAVRQEAAARVQQVDRETAGRAAALAAATADRIRENCRTLEKLYDAARLAILTATEPVQYPPTANADLAAAEKARNDASAFLRADGLRVLDGRPGLRVVDGIIVCSVASGT